MAIKIGIPRALMYYEYYPMWKTFFEELGAEVILSDHTTKAIMNDGSQICINDACLPIKIFHGHIINLLGKVDYLFIPRLRSVAKDEYICPKFSGLPEMIRFSINNLPPIIETDVYMRKRISQLHRAFLDTGLHLTENKRHIRYAEAKAMEIHRDYISRIQEGKTPLEVLENIKNKPDDNANLNIAVMGHIYNIYDGYVNMNLLKKITKQNIHIITPEMMDRAIVDTGAATLDKKMFWTFGRQQIGTAMNLIDRKIDGIIYIMSFGCGIDSFVADICERRIRRESEIPFFLMIIDEHSGEAGINTRLEAFIDMIKWRNKSDNISASR